MIVRRSQGVASRGAILDRGLRLAAEGGLPHASIGALASALGMSKSAVFAHFGSKPRLDVAIIDAAVTRFERQVIAAAATAPAGVARLVALAEAWLARVAASDEALDVLAASCPLARPAQRVALVTWQQAWRAVLAAQASAAVAAGELARDVPTEVIAFELDALLQAARRDADAGDDAAADRTRYAIEHALRRWSITDAPTRLPG